MVTLNDSKYFSVDFPEQFGEAVERVGGDILDAVGEDGRLPAVRQGAPLERAGAAEAARAAVGPGNHWLVLAIG